jgi:arylsulfatase A-like enzyme
MTTPGSVPHTADPPVRRVLSLATLLLLLALLPPALGAAERPPNIVLIIGDDHGWPYSGFMGHGIVATPNLDALARGGVVFRQAHATGSVCLPSLRSVLAGIHQSEWLAAQAALEPTFGPIEDRRLAVHLRTLPRELATLGYLSWEGGKMWEGPFAEAGFTHGLATTPGGPFTSVGDDFGRRGWREGTALAPLQDFLDQAGDTPFFAWVAPMLPHVPFDAPAGFRAPYEALGLAPAAVDYYANVSWLDAFVGRVVAELDARGLREDTLLVYLSDNGWDVANPSANGKGKGTLHELGVRTPLIFHWPGHVPAGMARDDLVSLLDVFPTLLAYAGAEPLDDRRGIDLRPAIENGSEVPRRLLVGHHQFGNAGYWVRTRRWRYILAQNGTERLYRIASDPFESTDVAAAYPALRSVFRDAVAAWTADLSRAPAVLDAVGTIRDQDGVPIAGTYVRLRGRSATGEAVQLQVLTSARGEFRFTGVPQGTYWLEVRGRAVSLSDGIASGLVPLRLPVGALGSRKELRAHLRARGFAREGTGTIRGVLHGSGGDPVLGGSVLLRRTNVRVEVRTDARGAFLAENLPAGHYRVVARAGSPAELAVGTIVLGEGGRISRDLRLTAAEG